MSKVYVLNHAGHNLSQAKKFGELVILTEGKVNIFSTDRLKSTLQDKLISFDPDKDYILLSGNNILSFIIANILYARFVKVNILIYNFTTSDYTVRDV